MYEIKTYDHLHDFSVINSFWFTEMRDLGWNYNSVICCIDREKKTFNFYYTIFQIHITKYWNAIIHLEIIKFIYSSNALKFNMRGQSASLQKFPKRKKTHLGKANLSLYFSSKFSCHLLYFILQYVIIARSSPWLRLTYCMSFFEEILKWFNLESDWYFQCQELTYNYDF